MMNLKLKTCTECKYRRVFPQVNHFSSYQTLNPDYVFIFGAALEKDVINQRGFTSKLDGVLREIIKSAGIEESQYNLLRLTDCVWINSGKDDEFVLMDVIHLLEESIGTKEFSPVVTKEMFSQLIQTQCKKKLFEEIRTLDPKVIVSISTENIKYFDACPFKTDIAKCSGRYFMQNILGKFYTVLYIHDILSCSKVRDPELARMEMSKLAETFTVAKKIARSYHELEDEKNIVIETVTSIEKLRELVNYFNAQKVIAFDVETTSLDWKEAKLTSVQLSSNPNLAYVFDLWGDTELIEKWDETKNLLSQILMNKASKVAHNGYYDMLVLRNHGMLVNNFIYDTHLMYKRLYETVEKPKTLNDLILEFCVMPIYDYELNKYKRGDLEPAPNVKTVPFADVQIPKSVHHEYGGKDVIALIRILPKLIAYMKIDNVYNGYMDMNRIHYVYADAQYRGIYIDVELGEEMNNLANELMVKSNNDLAKYYLEALGDRINDIIEETKVGDFPIPASFISKKLIETFDFLKQIDNCDLHSLILRVKLNLNSKEKSSFLSHHSLIGAIQQHLIPYQSKNADKALSRAIETINMHYERCNKKIEQENKKRKVSPGELSLLQLSGSTKALNPNSNTQMNELFNSLKIECPKHLKTVKGNDSFGTEVVEYLIAKFKDKDKDTPQFKCLNELSKYRKIQKLKSTYLYNDDKTKGLLVEVDKKTQLIHPRFVVSGAETGRPACNKPNVLNIPRSDNLKKSFPDHYKLLDVKRLFIPPVQSIEPASSKWKLVNMDYSQAEIWILGMDAKRAYHIVKNWPDIPEEFQPYMDQEWGTPLFDFYQNGYVYSPDDFNFDKADKDRYVVDEKNNVVRWKDVHSWVASVAFNVPPWEVDKTTRTNAKAVIFGINYGKKPKSMAVDLGITVPEAENVFETICKALGNISIYHKYIEYCIYNFHYIQNVFGRKRHFSKFVTNNDIREGYNYTPQSTVNDVIATAMLQIYDILVNSGLDFKTRICNNVYDSLMFYTTEEEIEFGLINQFKEIMEKPMPIYNASLRADVEILDRWAV